VTPRVVLVTGEPGSGKSTLGRELAAAMRVPFIARDDIRGGLAFSEGAWTDSMRRVPSGDDAVEVFLDTVVGLLERNVSCVVEYVVRRSRPADLERLSAVGDTVVVMVGCDDPMARVVQRNATDRLVARPAVLAAAGFSSVAAHTGSLVTRMRQVSDDMVRHFDVPVLHVDTTVGCRPDLATIIVFATTPRCTFRRLTRDDFELLAGWLAEPHVHEWWDHEYTPQALEHDFGRAIDGDEPAADFIAMLDGSPIGIVQYSRFVDDPAGVDEMADVYPVGDGAVSIDYLIGDPGRVGRGTGTAMIEAFVERIWRTDPVATHVVVPVNSANERSWRALLRAGFRLVARGELEPDSPRHDPMHEILRIDRPSEPLDPAAS